MDKLTTKIVLRARLASTLLAVKSKLMAYPGLAIEREGSEIAYGLVTNDPDHDYVITLGKAYIVFELHSASSPVKLMPEMLLRLLSVLSVLKDDYSVRIEDIYPYLLMVLAEPQLTYYTKARDAADNRNVDTVISRRLLEVLNENRLLQSDNAAMRKKLDAVLANIIVNESRGIPTDPHYIAAKYGMSDEELSGAIEAVKKSHEVVFRNGRIAVVR